MLLELCTNQDINPLNKMINISKKFIIFDLKLIKENKNIVDIKKVFRAKISYILIYYLKLICRLIKKQKNIKKIIFLDMNKAKQ